VPKVRSMLKRKMPALRALGLEMARTEERTSTSSKATLIHLTRKNAESAPETSPMNGPVNGIGIVDESNPLYDV
jgi:hypothetical protein